MNKKGEVAFIICVFSFVFCCFSVPIIIYATSSDVTPRQDIEINCPQQVPTYVAIYINAVANIASYIDH